MEASPKPSSPALITCCWRAAGTMYQGNANLHNSLVTHLVVGVSSSPRRTMKKLVLLQVATKP